MTLGRHLVALMSLMLIVVGCAGPETARAPREYDEQRVQGLEQKLSQTLNRTQNLTQFEMQPAPVR